MFAKPQQVAGEGVHTMSKKKDRDLPVSSINFDPAKKAILVPKEAVLFHPWVHPYTLNPKPVSVRRSCSRSRSLGPNFLGAARTTAISLFLVKD